MYSETVWHLSLSTTNDKALWNSNFGTGFPHGIFKKLDKNLHIQKKNFAKSKTSY